MTRFARRFWIGFWLAIWCVAPARADSFWVGAHAHGLLAEVKEGWGGAADLGGFVAWQPLPELAFGLDAACLFPLMTGKDERTTDASLRITPVFWLLSGEDEAWWYMKVGTGIDSLVTDGRWQTEWSLLAAAGMTVAPRDLVVHFGFELLGTWAPLADQPVRAIGLGGFVGWRL